MTLGYWTCQTCGASQRPGATQPETAYFGPDRPAQKRDVRYAHSQRFQEQEPCLRCGHAISASERQGTSYWTARSWQYEQPPDLTQHDDD